MFPLGQLQSVSNKLPVWGWLLGLLPLALAGNSPVPDRGTPAISTELCERFLIKWDADAPHPASGHQGNLSLEQALRRNEVGLVELRRRRHNGQWQLEQDVLFPFDDIRLMAVERLGTQYPGMIWRELAGNAGRTLFAEWGLEGTSLQVREWTRTGSSRNSFNAQGTLWMPLALLEEVRAGQISNGNFEVFDPLQKRIDLWRVMTQLVPDRGDQANLRRVEFRRSDGSLAGSYLFSDEQLLEFRWQAGGLRMERLGFAEFTERREAWAPNGTSAVLEPAK